MATQIPPKGVSDSPYKKYAIERALTETDIVSNVATITSNVTMAAKSANSIDSKMTTLNNKVDQMIGLLQELVDK